MGRTTSRKFQEGDEEAIVDLYNLITGRCRTVPQHRWEWIQPPEGQGSMWVIEHEDETGRKLVGHHGLIPVRMSYCGTPILAGMTENTMLHPDYRKKILYPRYEASFLEEARQRFDLVHTRSGFGVLRKIRESLGYQAVGEYANYVRIIGTRSAHEPVTAYLRGKLGNNLVSGVAALAVRLLLPILVLVGRLGARGAVDDSISVRQIDDVEPIAGEIDEFWEDNKKHFGISVYKNAAYLKWRLFDNPNITYRFSVARSDGELVGYVVTQKFAGNVTVVVDLHAKNNDEIIADTLLDDAVDQTKKDGGWAIASRTLLSDNFVNKMFRRNGFRNVFGMMRALNKANDSAFLVNTLSDDLDADVVTDAAKWYFMPILFEGIS